MKLSNFNQKGFAAIETVLIIVIIAIIGGAGYYVYSANKKTSDTLSAASKVAQTSPAKTTKKTGASSSTSQKYLTIQEWGVKLPLNSTDQGAYYTGPTSEMLSEYIYVFDKSIDQTSNANGVSCKDPSYPVFTITRLKAGDVVTSTDPNSSNFLIETNASMFKVFSFNKDYAYSGQSIHQSAPQCEDLNPSGDFQADTKIESKYAAIDKALLSSYENMRAQ